MRLTDAVIGPLVEKDGVLRGGIVHNGRSVSVTLDLDGEPRDGPLELARVVVSSLPETDRRAREAAATDLLSTYNEGWRHYQETAEDGQYIDVSQPILTVTEFSSRLELDSILVTGDEICELIYNDDGMFWGHSVVVSSFDAAQTWKRVTLFG